jgi:hypothetical protein
LLFEDVPLIQSATMNMAGQVLTLTFDKNLDPASPVVPARFFADNGTSRWDGVTVTSIVGAVLTLGMSTPIGTTGPVGSTYTVGTPILFDTVGLPAAFFSGFATSFT